MEVNPNLNGTFVTEISVDDANRFIEYMKRSGWAARKEGTGGNWYYSFVDKNVETTIDYEVVIFTDSETAYLRVRAPKP